MAIAAAYLFLLMIAVMNELNAQPIFTHKDCSYIFVFVVLITSSLQANNCTFCISLHLKNADFRVTFSFVVLLIIGCQPIIVRYIYILNTRGGYLKYRYQGSLCISAKSFFSQVINNIPVYPYTTLRFWWKRLPSLLYYPRFCVYDQFTWMYMETYLLEMQC